MAWIEPDTNIQLLHNVPLDNSYEHTIYFANSNVQRSYFAGLVKQNLTDYTYQRVQRGVARVGIRAESIYDCNYMCFQNSAFGTKWFYAFITAIEYVNNQCSEVYFELDVIQSWLFDFTPGYCFIERMHTATDYIGDNIIPEPLEVGEYIMSNYAALTKFQNATIVELHLQNETVKGKVIDGVYSGCFPYFYPVNKSGVGALNDQIQSTLQQPDNILSLYMVPSDFIPEENETDWAVNTKPASIDIDGVALTVDDTVNGHRPRNFKLLTYPYTFYHVDNGGGAELNLRYEFFQAGKPAFKVYGTITQPVEANLYPVGYKGTGVNQTYQAESLQISGFPMCAWTVDAYQAWVAQNSFRQKATAATVASRALSGGIMGAATAPAVGGMLLAGGGGITLAATGAMMGAGAALASSFGSIKGLMLEDYAASIASDITKGNLYNGGASFASGKMNFFGCKATIKKEIAQSIDDFFDMFGYAIKRKMVPVYNQRPHWTYIKTVGATITGSLPADTMNNIVKIFDNGITWWRNGSEVGQYNLDNRPTQRGVKNVS